MPVTDGAGRVAAAYLQPLLEAAGAHGIDSAVLAAQAGLAPGSLAPSAAFLPAAAYVRLLDAGAALAGDAHFGLHVGERVRMGTYSAYGMVLLSCKDMGQALEQTARYEGLAHDLGRSALRRDGDRFHYRWISHYPGASRHLVDSVFAGIRVCGDWLAGTPLPPGELAFAHDGGCCHLPQSMPRHWNRPLCRRPGNQYLPPAVHHAIGCRRRQCQRGRPSPPRRPDAPPRPPGWRPCRPEQWKTSDQSAFHRHAATDWRG